MLQQKTNSTVSEIKNLEENEFSTDPNMFVPYTVQCTT